MSFKKYYSTKSPKTVIELMTILHTYLYSSTGQSLADKLFSLYDYKGFKTNEVAVVSAYYKAISGETSTDAALMVPPSGLREFLESRLEGVDLDSLIKECKTGFEDFTLEEMKEYKETCKKHEI